jgi:glutamate formiminotransferase
VSEGRDRQKIESAVESIDRAGGDVIDVHSDERHNRTVLTVVARNDALVEPMTALATSVRDIDLQQHTGVHPRLGGLDVCPFVPHEEGIDGAIQLARQTGRAIAERLDLPVFLYGAGARREATRELPSLRRGGLVGLATRVHDLPPDFGPQTIDPTRGVVCVGARGPLIAFNVWLEAQVVVAREIAKRVRESASGLRGVRALGLDLDDGYSQVSLNLTAPEVVGIDDAYEVVAAASRSEGVTIVKTEIVGLIEKRFSPDDKKEAARLLIQPGRTLESALKTL